MLVFEVDVSFADMFSKLSFSPSNSASAVLVSTATSTLGKAPGFFLSLPGQNTLKKGGWDMLGCRFFLIPVETTCVFDIELLIFGRENGHPVM